MNPFKSNSRSRQVPGTSDASKTQSGLIGTYATSEAILLVPPIDNFDQSGSSFTEQLG